MFTPMRLFFFIIYLTAFAAVSGCGQIPAGREKTVNFAVTDFKLPAVMAYSQDPGAKMRVPSISTTKSGSETFIQTLIMQSVVDVLYEQGRSAFLSDYVISSILQQIYVQIIYEPINCINVIIDLGNNNHDASAISIAANTMDMTNCIIIDGTVANICTDQGNGCQMMNMIAAKTKAIPSKHLSILGSLKTSNTVMANWSNQMWQSVLNRVLRRIISSQYGKYFYGASVLIK